MKSRSQSRAVVPSKAPFILLYVPSEPLAPYGRSPAHSLDAVSVRVPLAGAEAEGGPGAPGAEPAPAGPAESGTGPGAERPGGLRVAGRGAGRREKSVFLCARGGPRWASGQGVRGGILVDAEMCTTKWPPRDLTFLQILLIL